MAGLDGSSILRLSQMYLCPGQYASRIRWPFGLSLLLFASSLSPLASESAPSRVTIGPFSSQESMAQVYPVLQRNRIPFETRLTSKRESLGFIVVTPVQQNAQDGQELTRELQTMGDKDVLYVKAGRHSNRVSVG